MPHIISLDALSDGLQSFMDHYGTPNGLNEADAMQTISWTDFKTCAKSVLNNNTVQPTVSNEKDIALKFIHRYTNSGGVATWYLCMAVCKIDYNAIPTTIDGKDAYPIEEVKYTNGSCLRYKIHNNTIAADSSFTDDADTGYLALSYDDGNSNTTSLSGDHVTSFVFPWYDQIVVAYDDNEAANQWPITDIKFTSVAFNYQDATEHSKITFPHSVVITFIDGSGELINNSYTAGYAGKGADMATLCPPNCLNIISV